MNSEKDWSEDFDVCVFPGSSASQDTMSVVFLHFQILDLLDSSSDRLNLQLLMESDAFICTWTSNWHRPWFFFAP